MNSHGHEEMMTVRCSPGWMLAHGPFEVNTVQREAILEEVLPPASPPDATAVPQAHVARPATRPTTEKMMASMRALRKQRATFDEAEMALKEIVSDNSRGSLMADVQSTASPLI